MAKRGFSIGEALGEGFRLAGTRPLSVFVWGLIVILPVIAQVGLLAGAFMNLPFEMFSEAAEQDDPSALHAVLMPAMMQAQLADLLGLLLRIIGGAAVAAAVYRVVLRPGEAGRRPFGLGLGMAELRVGVTYLAVVVGLVLLTIAVMLVLSGIGFGAWGQLTDVGRGWLIAVLVFALMLMLLAAYSRVCLIPPASIAEGDFAFESGWKLGAGHTGKLALMSLSLWALSMVLTLAGYALIALAGWGLWSVLGLGGDWPHDPGSLREVVMHDPRLLWLAGGLIAPLAWLYGFVMSLNLAPYASAVRQLVPPPSEPADAPEHSHP